MPECSPAAAHDDSLAVRYASIEATHAALKLGLTARVCSQRLADAHPSADLTGVERSQLACDAEAFAAASKKVLTATSKLTPSDPRALPSPLLQSLTAIARAWSGAAGFRLRGWHRSTPRVVPGRAPALIVWVSKFVATAVGQSMVVALLTIIAATVGRSVVVGLLSALGQSPFAAIRFIVESLGLLVVPALVLSVVIPVARRRNVERPTTPDPARSWCASATPPKPTQNGGS